MPSGKRTLSALQDPFSLCSIKRARRTTGSLTLMNLNQHDAATRPLSLDILNRHNATSSQLVNDVSSSSPTLVGSVSDISSESEIPDVQDMMDDSIQRARDPSSHGSLSPRRSPSFEGEPFPPIDRSRYLTQYLLGRGISLRLFDNAEHRLQRGSDGSRQVADETSEPNLYDGFETDDEGRLVPRSTLRRIRRARSLSSSSSSLSSSSSSTSSASFTAPNIQSSASLSSSDTTSNDESNTDLDVESADELDEEPDSESDSSTSASSDSSHEPPDLIRFPLFFPAPPQLPPYMSSSLQTEGPTYEDLHSRLREFMPRFQAANQALELDRENGTLADRDIENLGDQDDEYIEMVSQHPIKPP